MIDTHCHIDLYQDPFKVIKDIEQTGITTIAMTNLPSHFEMGYNHVLPFKKIRLALGMHPLYAERHENEYWHFKSSLSKTSYIGEVGLDFSREGMPTKEIQLKSFKFILNEIGVKKKLLSIHSRKAEKEVLEHLLEYKIKNAIFHWYSGPLNLIDKISDHGYYFSVNPSMIKSKSGEAIIERIPKEKLLTESDGPFIQIGKRSIVPLDIQLVIEYLSKKWLVTLSEVESIISQNFNQLISNLKP